MRIPMEWVRSYAPIPAVPVEDIVDALVRAGLEVEAIHEVGAGTAGPIVVGRVQHVTELTQFKKPIRFCLVEVGARHGAAATPGVRGIVCGASNFAAGDLVVVALPGARLPGDFVIASRSTYDHISDGMICSEQELSLGSDHSGIIVLPPESAEVGDDAVDLLGLGETVIEVNVTPDIGYCLSMRGVARELATAFSVPFTDPGTALADLPAPASSGYPCVVDDIEGAPLYTLHSITGFDRAAPTPVWMRRRLIAAGSRAISLAVDVTNYVMLETGQPLHAFDTDDVDGPIQVRRAQVGESFDTLDHVTRQLDAADLLIADDTGPIGLAGVIGGLRSEISATTEHIAVEAAWFDPVSISRTARRHKVSTDASRRFERGVDRVLAPYAGARATALLLELGGGQYDGLVGVEAPYEPVQIAILASLPSRVGGIPISRATVVERLEAVGARVADAEDAGMLKVVPPPWRGDLTDPADLVEEVLRLGGYDEIVPTVPRAPVRRGLTRDQRLLRQISRAVAAAGGVEVLAYPFVGDADFDAMGLVEQDERRRTLLLANPLSDEAPGMRTTLLAGLLAASRRNVGRGNTEVFVYEVGSVFRLRDGQSRTGSGEALRIPVDGSVASSALATLDALLPDQPLRIGGVLAGDREPAGWWGPARPATWLDAIEAVRCAGAAVGAVISVVEDRDPPRPFHPGRTGALFVGATHIGFAGELHPRVAAAYGLPARASAFEADLAAVFDGAALPKRPAALSTYPVAKEDIALVVPAHVPAARVEQAIREGVGEVLESVRLFDAYAGDQIPAGHVSLAYALRLRAPDRTLSEDEVGAARSAAIAAAAGLGAILRS